MARQKYPHDSPEWGQVPQATEDLKKLSFPEWRKKWPVLHAATKVNHQGMMARHKKDPKKYPVAKELKDFYSFLHILKPRLYHSASLDRKDPSKGYYPDNLRWGNKQTQSQNREDKNTSQKSPFPKDKQEAWERLYQEKLLAGEPRQAFMLRYSRIKMRGHWEEFDKHTIDLASGERLTPEEVFSLYPEVQHHMERAIYFYCVWHKAKELCLSSLNVTKLFKGEVLPKTMGRFNFIVGHDGYISGRHSSVITIRCDHPKVEMMKLEESGFTGWGLALFTCLADCLPVRITHALAELEPFIPEDIEPTFYPKPKLDPWNYPSSRPSAFYSRQSDYPKDYDIREDGDDTNEPDDDEDYSLPSGSKATPDTTALVSDSASEADSMLSDYKSLISQGYDPQTAMGMAQDAYTYH